MCCGKHRDNKFLEIMFAYLYMCLDQIFSDRLQIFRAYIASHEGLEFTDAEFEEVGLTQGDGKARIRALPFTPYKKVQTKHETTHDNLIAGTYAHPYIIPHVASWISAEFETQRQ